MVTQLQNTQNFDQWYFLLIISKILISYNQSLLATLTFESLLIIKFPILKPVINKNLFPLLNNLSSSKKSFLIFINTNFSIMFISLMSRKLIFFLKYIKKRRIIVLRFPSNNIICSRGRSSTYNTILFIYFCHFIFIGKLSIHCIFCFYDRTMIFSYYFIGINLFESK